MLVSRRVITSFPRSSLTDAASEGRGCQRRLTTPPPPPGVHGNTLTRRAAGPRSTPAPPLCCWRTGGPPETPRERIAASLPAPPASEGHRDESGGGTGNLFRRNHRLEEPRVYLDALRPGRPADDERRGGVGSEDVGARGLPTGGAVAVAGVVPATTKAHESKQRHRRTQTSCGDADQ